MCTGSDKGDPVRGHSARNCYDDPDGKKLGTDLPAMDPFLLASVSCHPEKTGDEN